jgi:hypothetical protein
MKAGKLFADPIHLLAGTLIIIGGISIIINKIEFGGVLAGMGLLIEALKNWFGKW